MKAATEVVVIVAGLIVAAGAGAGVAYAATRPKAAVAKGGSAAPPSPSSGSPTPAVAWIRTLVIHPGDRVRSSMTVDGLQKIAAQIPGVTPDIAGLSKLLNIPQLQQQLGTNTFTAWGPGNPLPADWPKDDPDPASEFHLEFTYGAATPLDLTTVPTNGITPMIWIAKGMGA